MPVVGPLLKKLLFGVMALFALLTVNAVYLVSVRGLEALTGNSYQNWFYLVMFLGHLVLGFLIVVPVLVFGLIHIRNASNRPNRRAVRAGYGLFVTALLLLASGLILTRIDGLIVVKDPRIRSLAFWVHVVTPLLAAWLFILHRLAGRRIRWRTGVRWAVASAIFALAMLALHSQDPRYWDTTGPESGEQYFFPSLARTATGNFIPERVLMNDDYCQECHGDIHQRWENSVHRLSSFNNPPYLASVRETRAVAMARDGDVQAARFCAGCHDPAVFFTGKFDDPDFDDIKDPSGQAGITCTSCHSITKINSVRGNGDYTIEEPAHYPFVFSENRTLQWVNRQLVKAKPDSHKNTFLKPLHRSNEFCGTCHKVHLPKELNDYKFLRGQNHYDAFLLSGVSGHGISSFYYPETATANCAECHMKLRESDDFGASRFSGETLTVHDHQFPSANTGVPHLLGMPPSVIQEHQNFNEGVMRVDLFGIKDGGALDGEITAPLRPVVPALVPGESYLVETVVRTLKMGHTFTQGTSDSNEVWLDLIARSGDRVIGRSGGLGPDNAVDPWAHFVNSYVLDRDGRRIDRRNAQDIFVPLYNHQIPPGAADVIHYRLDVPSDVTEPITVEAVLRFRKFDTTYMKFVYGEEFVNDLPILTLASDEIVFPLDPASDATNHTVSTFPEWQRWNDYGIGLLRKGGTSRGELRGAEAAFQKVEALGHPDGPLNLARVYLAQGTVQDQAIAALERAVTFAPPANPWSVAWFTGQVNEQNGNIEEAIANFQSILDADTTEMRQRGFDFSLDYRVLNRLGLALFERSNLERGESHQDRRKATLGEAKEIFDRVLELDPENVTAHYNLSRLFQRLDNKEAAARHLTLYRAYKPDDNARDRAIAIHRANNPAADHAAQAIVIYDLQREGAYELENTTRLADEFALTPTAGTL